jgi:NhaP-type Na+/H+ or K+/H+ antiporter
VIHTKKVGLYILISNAKEPRIILKLKPYEVIANNPNANRKQKTHTPHMVELASILVLSVFAQWLAWKIKVPAILPLIVIGLSLGPLSTFFTPDGSKIFSGDAIFSGDFLFSFVSISVGVILFEGGLTLKFSEIRSQASTVRNILIFGPLFTLLGGGLAAHYIMGLDYTYAFLFGALIIVSGPTVVLPILKNVKPNAKINTILKWEEF